MAGVILAASLANYIFDWPEIENAVFMPILLIGVLWILIRTNGKKYHVNRNLQDIEIFSIFIM